MKDENTTPELAVMAAERREAAANERALHFEMQGEILTDKIKTLEAAAMKRKESDAAAAVKKLVAQGKISREDLLSQMDFKAKFIADPTLIRLALATPPKSTRRKLL